jgi:hypothetical protein
MKISKNEVSKTKVEATKVETPTPAGVPLRSVIKSSTDNKEEACKYIKSAIDVLGDSARNGNAEARNAIANLSVILFELK